jgi:hypothetical protein
MYFRNMARGETNFDMEVANNQQTPLKQRKATQVE